MELHDRAVDALNRRDLDAFLELMSADVEALPRQAAIEGVYAGHAGIHHWWGDLLGALPDFAVEVVELRDLGDWTLAALRFLRRVEGGQRQDISVEGRGPRSRGAAGVGDSPSRQSGRDCCLHGRHKRAPAFARCRFSRA